MNEEEIWNPPQPTAVDFEVLERIAEERAALAATAPADRQGQAVRRHLLEILDRMEEELCVHGHREADDSLAELWRELAEYDGLRRGRLHRGLKTDDQQGEKRRRRRRRAARCATTPRSTAAVAAGDGR